MTLYVGYLELLVIGIGLVEIVDDDRCLERLHDLFGEEVGKEIGVENGDEEVGIQTLTMAHRGHSVVADPKGNSEPVENGYYRWVAEHNVAQF